MSHEEQVKALKRIGLEHASRVDSHNYGRPTIDRELEQAERRLAKMEAGLLAAYELAEGGRQKVEAQRQKVAALRDAPRARRNRANTKTDGGRAAGCPSDRKE